MEPNSTLLDTATSDEATLASDGAPNSENDSLTDDTNWSGSEPSSPPNGAAPATEPLPGSNAAASVEFGRNLSRLREAKGLSHGKLAALAECGAESVRDYEAGKYRPTRKVLWLLAQALDVMPISLGASSTRGEEGPEPFDLLMRRKANQTLRLQHLVVLLSDKSVSAFAQLVSMEVEEVYTVASCETKLADGQLDPFLKALPQVRQLWLERGEGEPLQAIAPATPSAPTTASPDKTAEAASSEVPASPEHLSHFGGAGAGSGLASAGVAAAGQGFGQGLGAGSVAGSVGVAAAGVRPLVIPTLDPGAPTYAQLGFGLVAEIDAVLLGGFGAVSGVRLLAGAGGVAALTRPEQLTRLFQAMSQVLEQRGGE